MSGQSIDAVTVNMIFIYPDVSRLTPLAALMITAVLLVSITLWVLTTAHQGAAARMQRNMLQECVSESGHKPMPCPQPGEINETTNRQ